MAPNQSINRCNNIDHNLDLVRNGMTLPNKYAKLMKFGVWLLANINISNDIRNEYFEKLNVFAPMETQADFYENFYSGEKETAKTMRKFITERLREQRKVQKDIGPKGRDQILRDAFIDNIMAKFSSGGRTNKFAIPKLLSFV